MPMVSHSNNRSLIPASVITVRCSFDLNYATFLALCDRLVFAQSHRRLYGQLTKLPVPSAPSCSLGVSPEECEWGALSSGSGLLRARSPACPVLIRHGPPSLFMSYQKLIFTRWASSGSTLGSAGWWTASAHDVPIFSRVQGGGVQTEEKGCSRGVFWRNRSGVC